MNGPIGRGFCERNDLENGAARHDGKALQFQNGEEDIVDAADRNLHGGKDRHLSLDLFIDDEILAGKLADKLDEDGKIDVIKIESDQSLFGSFFRLFLFVLALFAFVLCAFILFYFFLGFFVLLSPKGK